LGRESKLVKANQSRPWKENTMNATEQTILEQFSYWQQALELDLQAAQLEPGPIVVIGCGTSYYLAQSIAAALNQNPNHNALAVPSGEWHLRRRSYISDTKVQVLALSRSGITTETIAAASASLEAGERVIGISCEPNSELAKVSTQCVYVPTHPLEDIVMTTSASLMLLVGLALTGIKITAKGIQEAQNLLEHHINDFDNLIAGRSHFVYLGGGALYGIACEGALKLMEMSLSFSQAYHPLEYRHGPISLIDQRSIAVMLYSPDTLEAETKLVGELRGKGAKVIGFGGAGDLSLELSDTSSLRGLIALPTLQWLGERVAQQKGLNTREPRHLTKVVVLT
jgi:glutamine---fructose-6-phosphate transaminase (isomerizing)